MINEPLPSKPSITRGCINKDNNFIIKNQFESNDEEKEENMLNINETQNLKNISDSQDPFWLKEAQTISELPKVLSVFYNDEGKIRRTSYILNYRENKPLSDVLEDLKKLFQIPSDQHDDPTEHKVWKLHDFNGELVKRTQDLYFQFASSFVLCQKVDTLKLPKVDPLSNHTVLTNGQSVKPPYKLPNVQQFRPSSNTTDFLGRVGNGQSSTKPYLSKQEMGWIFGLSNLKIVNPDLKRKTRSISPTNKKLISDKQITTLETKPPKATKNATKVQTKSATVSKPIRITASKRSLSADENVRLSGNSKKIISEKIEKEKSKGKTKKKDKKSSSKKVAEETSVDVSEQKVNNSDNTDNPIMEILDNPMQQVNNSETVNEESNDKKPVNDDNKKESGTGPIESVSELVTVPIEPKVEEIISQKNGSFTERLEPVIQRPVDIFGVPLQNVPMVRRGSLPLRNWVIPISDISDDKKPSEFEANKIKATKPAKIVKTYSLDVTAAKRNSIQIERKEKRKISGAHENNDLADTKNEYLSHNEFSAWQNSEENLSGEKFKISTEPQIDQYRNSTKINSGKINSSADHASNGISKSSSDLVQEPHDSYKLEMSKVTDHNSPTLTKKEKTFVKGNDDFEDNDNELN